MKLLVDCSPLHAGGGVQVAIALLENLRQSKEIDWVAIVPEPMRTALTPALDQDDRLTFIKKATARDVFNIRSAMKRFEQEYAPDVVFTVFGPAYFCASAPHLVGFAIPHLIYKAYARMPMGKRLRHAFLDRLRFRLLRQADRLVVETSTVQQRLAQRLGVDVGRICVIGNSLNPLLARHVPKERSAGGAFGLLIPSTYYSHKNLEIVPAVAQALEQLDPEIDFEFRFTLDAASAPWQNMKQLASKLGVAHRITTLGPLSLDDLASAYNKASAVFLPTLREASTAVYPESFYFRRPLITSDLDFARELCDDAALYVPPLEAKAIAAQIQKLALSPELASRLVEKGQQQLLDTYPDPDKKFQMQLDLLKQLCDVGRN